MNRRFLNSAIWIVLFIFLLPSSLAVASWNSLPGSRLYTTKLFMEQALVYLIPDSGTKGTLQIAYTERRMTDATRMLSDQSSVQGLSYLDSQVNVTKQAILTTKDPVVKKQLAQKYIATLQNVNSQLESQKQLAQQVPNVPPVTGQVSTIIPTPTPTRPKPTPTPRPSPAGVTITAPPATPTPTPTVQPPTQQGTVTTQVIVSSISNTQEQINNTISQIEHDTGGSDSGGARNPNNNGNQGSQNSGNNWNNGNNGNNWNNGNNGNSQSKNP